NAMAFQQLMFANQPGVEGLTDEQIEAFATEAGASEQAISDIRAGTYAAWVDQVADPHGEETGGGTPYVESDGTTCEGWNEGGARRRGRRPPARAARAAGPRAGLASPGPAASSAGPSAGVAQR